MTEKKEKEAAKTQRMSKDELKQLIDKAAAEDPDQAPAKPAANEPKPAKTPATKKK